MIFLMLIKCKLILRIHLCSLLNETFFSSAKLMEGVLVSKCHLVDQDGVIAVHQQEAEIGIVVMVVVVVVTKEAGGDQGRYYLQVFCLM